MEVDLNAAGLTHSSFSCFLCQLLLLVIGDQLILLPQLEKEERMIYFFIVQAVVLKMYTFGSSNGIHKFEFTCLNCSAYKFISNKRFYLDTSSKGTF